MKLTAAALSGAAVAVLGWRAAWDEPRSLVVPEVGLELPGWPERLDGLRVALVSDVHAGAGHMTPARLAAVVDRVLAAEADVHLLLGDYLDSTVLGDGRARVLGVARELARLPGAVAVLGNHDWRGSGPAMGWALRDCGVRVLENSACELRPGLWAAGVADTRHAVPDSRAALSSVPGDAVVLLLCHDPDFFPRAPARAALMVSGHLHGGQVNIPHLRRLAMPTAYGDRYLAGHVVEGGRHLYVSAGLGTAGLPVRLFRRPEVPVLRITGSGPRTPGV
ncbi:MAG TPA: metallophosphoesterase [Solirubrobacteraceae bacterium]|nr:metallophosphoesterase [Solirubrobacteraceae bacterium]